MADLREVDMDFGGMSIHAKDFYYGANLPGQYGNKLDIGTATALAPTITTSSLSSVGTITTGTWQGTTIASQYLASVNLTSGVTSTLPVANGGTGDTGTPWTSYSPAISQSGGGSLTASINNARYKTIGKTVQLYVDFTITAQSGAGNAISVSLPINALNTNQVGSGRENGVTGVSMLSWVVGTSTMFLQKYDGTLLAASGHRPSFSLTYESV